MATTRAASIASQLARFSSPSRRSLASSTRSASRVSPFILPHTRTPPSAFPVRFAHTIPKPPAPSTQSASVPASTNVDRRRAKKQEPHYELTFTCVPCGERSAHVVSKQGYHHGSVLISCPSCRNRHVISDHLRIFGDKNMTVEDLMREKGQLVKKGTLGEDGDLEFWEDGTVTPHQTLEHSNSAGESKAADSAPPGASFTSVGGPSKTD